MCTLVRHTICESLVKIYIYMLHQCRSFFSHIGQCFRPAQTKSLENKKSGQIRVNLG